MSQREGEGLLTVGPITLTEDVMEIIRDIIDGKFLLWSYGI